jgi:exopolyphosphatase/guanosine-5'-triphosphate,3'-diphosphate pyrophosphatase
MLRLAAIDVGSNATRLVVVELSSVGVVRDAASFRWAVRLGTDTFSTGSLDQARQVRLVDAFREIARTLETREVTRYRAVATAAMRGAKNAAWLAKRIRRETGIDLEIISGSEESRLSRDALVFSLGTVPADTLLVDLGGGSVELHPAGDRRGRSIPLGTVRLVERHPELEGALTRKRLDELRREIGARLASRYPRRRARLAVGTGGNLDALSRLSPARCGLYPGIDLRRLPGVTARKARLSPGERVTALGLRPDRADVIIPAALVLLAVRDVCRLERFVVPGTGIRESLLQKLAADSHERDSPRRALTQLGLGRRPRDRQARLATRLFDLLAPLHHLWAPARRPLLAATYLYDVGERIDPPFAVRHTAYVLTHLADLELGPTARRVAAAAVAHAAGADPTPYQSGLDDDERRACEVLGAVVALARHLDAAGVREPRIDVTVTPPRLEIGMRLPPALQRQLRAALRTRLRAG